MLKSIRNTQIPLQPKQKFDQALKLHRNYHTGQLTEAQTNMLLYL